jgi:hypothetical protein
MTELSSTDHSYTQTTDKRIVSKNPGMGAIENFPIIGWISNVPS